METEVRKVLVQNQIKCKLCGDVIFSGYRHHFVSCKCGKVSVDGGMDYARRVGEFADIEDQSIWVEKDSLDKWVAAVKWAKDTERNDLGIALALMRTMIGTGHFTP
jgi:hypothetical protein